MKAQPRHHLKLVDVATRLGHSPRWVRDRVREGVFEGFMHAENDITVSLESILAYEERTRISAANRDVVIFDGKILTPGEVSKLKDLMLVAA